MADSARYVGSTPVKNPLLSAAGNSFPFENFTCTAQLVPVSKRASSISLSEDVGEPDSFLGQDEVPSLPLPGVQPSALKTPSPEQLQSITFFNALGQPTGGGGLDFLAPAGANTKSINSSTQSRYKQLVNKRRPLSASLGVIPSRSLNVPPASSSTDLLPPTSVDSSTTVDSPLLQEPSISSLLSLLTPKSSSTPTTPKTQVISTTSSGNLKSKSQSIPSTLKSSPVHVQSTLHENPVPLNPESAYSNVQLNDQTSTSDTGTLGLSLVQKLLNLTSETLSPSPQRQVPSYKPEVTKTHSVDDVSSQSERYVSETVKLSAPNKPEVSLTDSTDRISVLPKPEVPENKSADEISGLSENKNSETNTANEPATDNSNSAVQTAEPDDGNYIKSSFESTAQVNVSNQAGSITGLPPLNTSDASNATYSLEGTSNQLLSSQFDETVGKNIPSSKESHLSALPSNQYASLPGGISASLFDDQKSSLITDENSSQAGNEVLNSDDQTSKSVDQLEGSCETLTKVPTSNQSEDLVTSFEVESQVITKEDLSTSKTDTESIQLQAKSPSTISQLSSTEQSSLQPISSSIVTQNTNFTTVTYQNTDSSFKTSQENYVYSGNQPIFHSQVFSGVSAASVPPSSVSASIQAIAELNNVPPPSSQHPPIVPQESLRPQLKPSVPTDATSIQSSPNPYRVRSGHPRVSSPLQYTNSPLYNPQQFFVPSAQNLVSSSYSQPTLFSPVPHQAPLQTYPSPTPPSLPSPTPPPAKQIVEFLQPSSSIYSVPAKPPIDQANTLPASKPPPIFSSPQPPTNPVYPSATPPTSVPPPAAQPPSSQPPFNKYSIHAKSPSSGGINPNQYHQNTGQFPLICPPSSQSTSFPVQSYPTPPSVPVPSHPPAQQTHFSQESLNKYPVPPKSPANEVNISNVHSNLSQPPPILPSSSQQPSIHAQPSPTPPLNTAPTPPITYPPLEQTASTQPPPNKYSLRGTSSNNDNANAPKFPLNTSHPPLTYTAIPEGPYPARPFIPLQHPVQPSPTPPLIPVPTPPPSEQQTHAPQSLNRPPISAQPPQFFSPILQQSSHPPKPPATPPSTPALGPPPLAQDTGTSQTSANRYSIHARPAHLRNPYRVFSSSGSQPSPNPQPAPNINPLLVTPEPSADSFSSIPLTSDTNTGLSNNIYLGQREHQLPPLPISSPHVPTSAPPQQIQENIQKSFPVQGAVNSPSYPPPQPSIASAAPTLSGTSDSFATEKPNQIPPSVDIPLENNSPAFGTLILPQSSQGSSSVHLNAATPPNTVPTISSSLQPPSGIPLGSSAQGYRLGKQRPKYAQVPDLTVSPCSPLFSPSVLNSNDLAASPEFSPYQTQECFVPSENFAYPGSEFSSQLYSNLAQQGSNVASAVGGYQPVYCHWFFRKEIESKAVWKPFSLFDSATLEDAFNSSETNADTVIPTDGGRYDVHILQRERVAVYWEEKKPTEVRRCSWFYKGALDSRYTPYDEVFASQLEEEYKLGVQSNKWNRKVEYNGETVVMHGPVVMVHYSQSPTSEIGVVPDSSPVKPRVVKRGVDEFEFEEGETAKVDHLLFLVHGIGSVCDLKFRDVVETVDDFRSLALQLTRSHFSACVDSGQANRVEVLPVSWHGKLHGEDTGIDKKLQSITLKSIPRLRYFTNDTLLDILFYTSPVYCQTIMDTVGNEMNRMYDLFLKRNPDFGGTVCLGGHSLGSLILFDLLYHQKPPKNVPRSPAIVMTVPGAHPPSVSETKTEKTEDEGSEEDDTVDENAMAMSFARLQGHNRRASRVNYMMGPAGTGQPYISYPQLKFKPESFFALGSPIGMFVTVRGIETLGNSFRLPTCPGFFNIFHPFDPVAYRIESLIDPDLASNLRPVLIPHHKGRKRMHLELKETMQRVGSDLKNKLVDSVKNTWNTMTQYSMFSRSPEQPPLPPPPQPQPTIGEQVTKALEAHLGPAQVDPPSETESESGDQASDVTIGCLNGGRRVDYVLQEAPLESFNEYLFALQSHVCYWESEDTMLMILTEVYRGSGVSPDSVLLGSEIARDRSPIKLLSDQFLPTPSPPKSQLFSSLRFPSSASLSSEGTGESVSRSQSIPKLDKEASPTLLSTSSPPDLLMQGGLPPMGMDPTAPMGDSKNLAPPPTMGFVKQSLQRK